MTTSKNSSQIFQSQHYIIITYSNGLNKSVSYLLIPMSQSQYQQINFLPVQSSFTLTNEQERNFVDGEIGELKDRVMKLEEKLEKRNQLIKYLERKCGNQIIRTTKKLQQEIVRLQFENSTLKNFSEFSKNNRSLLPEYDQQSFAPVSVILGKEAYTPRTQKTRIYETYREELLKLNEEELREIIVMQMRELEKIGNRVRDENFFGSARRSQKSGMERNGVKKSLGKESDIRDRIQGKCTLKASSSKKGLKTQRAGKRCDSNKNLKRNGHGHSESALKDSTSSMNMNVNVRYNVNLNLNENLNINISSPSLSASKKEVLALQLPEFPILQSIKPVLQTKNQQIQTLPNLQNFSTQQSSQTNQTMSQLEQYQMSIIELQIENDILRKQVERLMKENNGLKEEAVYFEERVKDYYKEYEQVGEIGEGMMNSIEAFEIPSEGKNQVPEYYGQLVDNYRQILEIFGIDPSCQSQQWPENQHEHDKKHQKLLHEICNVKLQISHLLKQFKKIEKDLHQSFQRNNILQCQLKFQEEHIIRIEQYNGQILGVLNEVNEEMMGLRGGVLGLRFLSKMGLEGDGEEEGETLAVDTMETQEEVDGECLVFEEEEEGEGDDGIGKGFQTGVEKLKVGSSSQQIVEEIQQLVVGQ